MITFEDFQKMEIKIGTVKSAERVPDTDKLLKIVVDMGNEERQVIAGFGNRFSPEDLIGKQVPILLNIEPTKIRGVDSHGIFIALQDEQPVLLVPEEKVKNGAILK